MVLQDVADTVLVPPESAVEKTERKMTCIYIGSMVNLYA
jgi:hypothetical protein